MKARILTQIAIAVLLGIVGARYGQPVISLVLTLGLAVWWNRSQRIGRIVCGVAACVAATLLGGWRWQSQQHMYFQVEERFADQEAVTLMGTVFRKEEKQFQVVYYLKDSYFSGETGWWNASSGLIYLDAERFVIGDTIKLQGTYQEFKQARNEGNFDPKEFYHGKNLAFQVKADTVERLTPGEDAGDFERLSYRWKVWMGRWKEGLYQLRKRIRPVFERHLPASQAGILSVMTLGDKGILEDADKELYRQAGISHVLAISGLHISLLGMGIFRLLRKIGASYGVSGIASGILLLCFGQLAGMEVSTGRAVLMFLVMLLGSYLGMAYDSVTALSLSALLTLVENPAGLWYAGFQFSYGAVLAVVVAAKIYQSLLPKGRGGKKEGERRSVRERCRGALKNMGETLLVSSCIQLATLPLTLWNYFEFPLYTILINGLLLPLMGILLFLGIAGGLIGLLWPGLSWLILQPAGLLLSWNDLVCRLFLKLPSAQVVTGRPAGQLLCLHYALLGICLCLLWLRGERLRRQPGEPEIASAEGRKGRRRGQGLSKRGMGLVLALLPVCSLCLMMVLPRETSFEIAFLDVGQGDGIYIETPEGTALFVDGGSSDVSGVGDYRILSFLKYRGVGAIDGWFVSHGDNDHISGLLEAWDSGYPVRRLFMAEGMVEDEVRRELVELAGIHGTQISYLSPGQRVALGETTFTCLAPEPAGNTDRNAASLVLLLKCQGVSALLNGDISISEEQKLQEAYPGLRADVYKAAHHGSKHSNGKEFLEALHPRISVVSCSVKNRYGHPGKEAVEHMEGAGSQVFYTMASGQITVGGSGEALWVRKFIEDGSLE